ncbi:MAG: DUF4926 domain-containing protein [bacterium]|nr:DUF4926 domain-containing protein [bacterium]
MIAEHEQVVLTSDLPDIDLQIGDVGIVVHVYQDAEAYEVEFFTLDGRTIEVVTLEAAQLRPVNRRDVLHARERTAG